MNLIYLIKIMNLIALIFIPFNYIFAVLGYNNRSGLIYLWLCIIGFIINHFSRKKSKLVAIPFVILFLPLIWARSMDELIYLGAYFIVTMLLILKSRGSIKYDMELDIFKKGIYICISTFIISLMGGIHFFSSYSGHFVIIYLVSTILLLRNLRFLEYNKESREGKRINYSYSIIIVIFSMILSISNVRVMLFKVIKKSYIYITELFMYLFSWFFLGIGYIISLLLNALKTLMERLGVKSQDLGVNILLKKLEIPKEEEGEALVEQLLDSIVFQIFVKVFVIAVIGYILIKVFSNFMNRESELEDYLEEKEFIPRSGELKKGFKKSFLNYIIPRNNEEQVRLYYQKYMKKCIDSDIEINENDTTEDINNKSKKKFDNGIIHEIRNVYIKIRYGEKEATRETVKEIEEYYNKIKKK